MLATLIMSLPKKLYKYEAFNTYSITKLKNQQIYFRRPADLNDPFDCAISLKSTPLSQGDYQAIYDRFYQEASDKLALQSKYITNGAINDKFKRDMDKGIIKAFEDRKRINLFERGVSCFSEKYDDILMWSHYADGHKGFCLEFDTKYEPFSKARKVEYAEEIPSINRVDAILDDIESDFMKMITTKYCCWRYEKEWRIFHLESNKFYGYPGEALTGVYLGSEMNFAHLEIIALILQGQNPNIKMYKAIRDSTKFAVDFQEVAYTPHIEK